MTREEEKMIRGECGIITQKSMEILVTLGETFGAERLVEVTSAHLSGVSYANIGDPGLEFLEEWAASGTKALIQTTINPCGMDVERWREFGISENFAKKQIRIVRALEKMGASKSLSCTPYIIGNKPRLGDHVAWAESSAIVFANSILGARTNREGGPSALASAITGRTPLFGYHLDEKRRPTHEIHVGSQISGVLEYSLLGYYIGKKLEECIPLFRDLKNPSLEELKALSAGLAASGSVALYHIPNVTPEEKKFRGKNYESIDVKKTDLIETMEKLSTGKTYEHVCIGCPQCSLKEIAEIAERITGKKVKRNLWIFSSSQVCEEAKRKGYFATIEKAGGKVISDTCMVVAPMQDMGVQGIVTNSCKAAHYTPNTCKVPATLKSLDECVEAALR
ncbi:MAG: aconitase X catalytic domain-containing protein [Candidatus Bathyarchaeota archaeon]